MPSERSFPARPESSIDTSARADSLRTRILGRMRRKVPRHCVPRDSQPWPDEERSLGSFWSLGIRILVGCSIVKERMLRACRKRALLRMLNRFMLGMLTQKYRYVKRYFYVVEEQRDTRESRRGVQRSAEAWHIVAREILRC